MRSWLLQSISLAIQQRRIQLRLSLLVYVSLTLVVQVLRDSVIEVVLSGYIVKANSHSNNYLHLAKNSSKYISFSAWKTISTGVPTSITHITSSQLGWTKSVQWWNPRLLCRVPYNWWDLRNWTSSRTSTGTRSSFTFGWKFDWEHGIQVSVNCLLILSLLLDTLYVPRTSGD